ncbi:cytochrome-c oxidase, cbb3-type subunit III [Thioflexithrix psekupsensis]|uniref:Cbb3-type cytochrome c oxidase subunit n=1 Tax=Thioflexithrix psekupsensis TaxID=1570016 RepID=A0A251X777_9GAMM|nr:cytochrome-c oxidase, cbb3-type subunit III [Thioflexithrix psekupsensis]OUD13244.1 cytochrome-c oxidase, cbb3-type subunit III [Thioflexithrix psekupsensis]
MFDSDVFVSDFWDWFIIVPTLLGIAACFWLVWWQSGGERPEDKDGAKTMGHVWDESLAELNNPLPMWWLNMFYITLVFGLIYLILFPGLGSFKGILGWTSTNQYQMEVDSAEAAYGPIYAKYATLPVEELVKNQDALQIGERLFLTYCTACHGSDAGGNPGYPNLKDGDWLWGDSPQAIKTSIAKGRNAVMPDAKTNNLQPEEVDHVIEYVMQLSGREVNAELAQKGQAVYGKVCVACHMPTGTGMHALGAPNLTDNIWLYGGSREAIKETVTYGRRGVMPAHGEFLGDAKVHLLAAYIYGLNKAE